MYREWDEADTSLADILRRAGFGQSHGKKLIGLIVAFTLSVGIGISTSPAALASESSTSSSSPATSTESVPSSTDATEETSTQASTSTAATSTEATSTEATSTEATSTEATSTEATSSEASVPAIDSVGITGIARVGQVLGSSVVASGNPEPTLSYQWESASTVDGSYSAIAGATSASYEVTESDLFMFIRLSVVAENASGSVGPVSSVPTLQVRGESSFGIAALGDGVSLAIVSGNGQSRIAGSSLTTAIIIQVTNASASPVEGESVTAAVVLGGGNLGITTFTSDVSGQITIPAGTWTLGGFANTLDVYIANSATKVTVNATGLVATTLQFTAAPPNTSAVVGTVIGSASVRVFDQNSNPLQGATVTFATSGGGGDGSIGSPTVITGGDGLAGSSDWRLGTQAGTNTLSAYLSGTATFATINAQGTSLPASVVSVVPGAASSATVGNVLPSAVLFVVTDSFTNPISGQTVTFAASAGSTLATVSAVSDVNGTVTVPLGSWTLSTTAGNNFLYAYLNGTSTFATFTATGNPDLAATLSFNISSGSSTVGFSQSSVVTVVDRYGNPVPNQTVTFAIAIAGPNGASVSPASAASNSSGQVPVTFTMGSRPGTYTLSAFIENTSTNATVTFVAVEDTASSITAAIAQNRGSATVGTSVGALSVTVTDEFNNPIAGFSVTFAATGGGLVGPATSVVVATTNTEGVASIPSWTLASAPGTNNVIATGEGSVGSVTFTAVGTVDQASQISIVSGQSESATVGTSVQVPLVVRVQDSLNNSVSGATVTAAVATGGGIISITTAVTGENGTATFASGAWTLGTTSGINNNTLTVFLSGTSTSVTFTASGNADVATQILPAISTNRGSATVGSSVGALSVTVLDIYGNSVSGATVTIALSGGGGDGVPSSTSALTDSNGFASIATWNLGTTVGTNTAVVNLVGTSSLVTFTAMGTQGSPNSFIQAIPEDRGSATVGTSVGALSVTVFDQYGNTVSGATVTFAVTGTYVGALSSTQATTNSQGLASVNSWTLSVSAGINLVGISVTGSALLTSFTAVGTPDIADAVGVASNQISSATLGTSVQVPLTVTVSDQYGNSVSGATVTFVVATGNGSLSVTSANSVSGGIATLPPGSWTLSTTVGTNNNTLQAYLSGTSTFVTFTASSSPDIANRIEPVGNTDRGSATVGTSVGALSVTVFDQYNNTISGATVTVVVTGGGGIVTSTFAVANADGLATFAGWTLGATVGTNTAVVYLAGTNTAVTFTAAGTIDVPALIVIASGSGQNATVTSTVANPITVLVTDRFLNRVNAVSVTYAVSGGLGSVSGSGTLTTAVDGTATLAGGSWQLGEIAGTNSLAFYIANTSTSDTATAVGTAASVSLANSLLTAAPTSIVANDTSTSVISLQLRDTYGNNSTSAVNTALINISFDPIAGWEASSVWTLVSPGLYQRVLQSTTQTGLVTLGGTVSGVAINDTATVALTVGPPSRIVVAGGENQTTTVATAVPSSLLVNVFDAQDRLLDGVTVTYAVTGGGGSIAGSSTQTVDGTATLGAWTLGQTAGINTVVATVSGTSLQQTFTATGTVDVPAFLNVVSGASQTGVVNNLVPAALVVNVTDQHGNDLNGVSITYAVVGQGSIVGSSENSDVNGTATLGAWTLGAVPGTNTVVAYISGTATGATFNATGQLPLLTIGSGQGQTAVVNTNLSNPLTVQITDQNGIPVNGQSLTYAVVGGGGSIAGSPITSVNGTATLGAWTLGTTAGTNTVVVYVDGTSVSASFTATGVPGAPLIQVATGQDQTSTVNTIPTVPLSVTIVDSLGNLISGQTVTFAVTGGGGSVAGTTAASVDGIASIGAWTLGVIAGTNTVDVYISGTASFVTFTATGVHDIPVTLSMAAGNGQEQVVNTALSGPLSVTVTDRFGNAVSNASVTFGVTGGGGSLASTSSVSSGISGVASLLPLIWTLGTTAGTNTVVAYLSGTSTAVTFTASGIAGVAVPANSLITASPTANSANGTATSVISLQLRDLYGNNVTTIDSISIVDINSTVGFFPNAVFYAGNGVFQRILQAPLGSTQSVTAIIDAQVNSIQVVSTASVAFVTPVLTLGNSSLTANPSVITADGTSTSVISVQLRDQFGNNLNSLIPAPSVSLSANEGSLLGSMQNMGNGLYQQILEASLLTVTSVISANVDGSTLGTTAEVYFAPGPATIISIIDGNGQSATVGTAVTQPLTVTVSDSYGHLLDGATVTFAVVNGVGQTTFTSVQTVNGTATLGTWTLGTVSGINSLQVFISGTSTEVTFTAAALPGAPSIIAITGGDNQSARVSTVLSNSLSVTVSDQYGNLLTGVTVTFAVTLGGGSLSSLSATSVDGTATVSSWQLGSVVGTQRVQAFISGTANSVTFVATGTAIPTPPAPPAPAPEPTPAPVITPTPPPAPVPTLDWNPVGATVTPAGSIIQIGGVTEAVTVAPNASRDGLLVRGTQWGVNAQGIEFGGGTAGLLGDRILVVQAGQQVLVSGFGYQPNTVVKVFGYGPVTLLGEITVNAQGSFEASLLVPLAMQVGSGALQVNGFAPNGLVRSTSIGMEIRKPAMEDGTRVITRVFFASKSSELTAKDQQDLADFLAQVPRGAVVSTLFMGFAGPNAKDDVRATGISRNRANNTADYMRSIGLRGDIYTSGEGRSKTNGINGRKVIVKLNYKVVRSVDFGVGELKQMMLG